MVSLHEALAKGLAMSTELGLENLPSLCPGGETISIARLFHYLPYQNGSHGGHCDGPSTLNGDGKQVLSGSNCGFPSCLCVFVGSRICLRFILVL